MNMKCSIGIVGIVAVALGLSTWSASAQQAGGAAQNAERPARREGAPGQGQRPQTSPLIAALDINGDGVIDADEIAKAPASLKKLDKNGDGKLTADEYRPARGARRGGGEAGAANSGTQRPERPARNRPANQ